VHKVEITFKNGQSLMTTVEGWSIGDPDGWIQLIGERTVDFFPLETIDMITVPRLAPEEENND
jgi:hypothetical protein